MKFLFEVRIRPGYSAEEYADAWVRASEIIQRHTGARGTRLHRKIGDPSVLLAVATWASKADRDAMEARRDERVAAIVREQSRYCEIRIIGEFEDAEWVVDPDLAVEPDVVGEPRDAVDPNVALARHAKRTASG